MKTIHTGLLLMTLAIVAACAPDTAPPVAATAAAASAADSGDAATGAPTSAPELPVRIGEATPAPVTASRPGAEPLNSATVYDAVASGMGPAAADIDVNVEGGIVVLTGTVKNQADFQAAHYISRALDGVDEVDASGLKVR